MSTTITQPGFAQVSAARSTPGSAAAWRYIGLSIMALVPAAFWTAVVNFAFGLSGAGLSTSTLLGIGGTIAAVLIVVCSSILVTDDEAERR